MMECRLIVITMLGFAFAGAAPARAQDWLQWRGPNRDGTGARITVPQTLPDQLKQHWKVEVGPGYATPLLEGDRIYMFSRKGEDEVMRAMDVATGEILWETSYPASFTMQRSASRHGPGPKSTPVLSGGNLFSIGMTGAVTAFDAATGKILWQHEGNADQMPMYTTHSFSPLIDGGLVFFHTGGHDRGALKAYDVNTGAIKWSWDGDAPGYGSPILVELGGTRQLITITKERLVGLEPGTGKELWIHPYATRNFTNSMTPMLYGEALILSATDLPISAIQIEKRGTEWVPSVKWANDDATMRMTNGVIFQDMYFSLSVRNSGQYFSMDAKTGETLWLSEPRQAENASLLRTDEFVFSLEDDGELVIFRPGRAEFEVLKRYTLADTPTWTQPVFSGSRILIKDVATLALWSWD
jgi:outer membrane protein assembly factor BamB